MWPFSLLKKKLPPSQFQLSVELPSLPTEAIDSVEFLSGMDETDYLGKAAHLGDAAKAKVKERKFDEAWRLLHEQKAAYSAHANRYGMTPRQTIALDGSVHADLANIRRLEGNHLEAFMHFFYSVCSSKNSSKSSEQKLLAYFKRCGFVGVDLSDFFGLREDLSARPDFKSIRRKVSEWNERTLKQPANNKHFNA